MGGRPQQPAAWRTALVTGGGSGIGRGIALALARRDVSVALVGRRREPLETVAAEIASMGGQALAFPTDLTQAGDRLGLRERIHAALGPIDVLANNAGVLASGELAALTPAANADDSVSGHAVAGIGAYGSPSRAVCTDHEQRSR